MYDLTRGASAVPKRLSRYALAVAGGRVPGGGVAYVRAVRILDNLDAANEDQKAGIRIVRRALEEPLRQIASNAGDAPDIVIERVRAHAGGLWLQRRHGRIRGPSRARHSRSYKGRKARAQECRLRGWVVVDHRGDRGGGSEENAEPRECNQCSRYGRRRLLRATAARAEWAQTLRRVRGLFQP